MTGMGGTGNAGAGPVPKLSGSNDPFEHEERFLLTRGQVGHFFEAVGPRATAETYDPARPISYTRTTYFDTDDFAYLRSCEGPLARRLRIREYALAASLADPPTFSGAAFLELKQNAGTARSKVRLFASPELLCRLLDPARGGEGRMDARLDAIDPHSPLAALEREMRTPGMAPRLTTWYRRVCLSAENGRVRITLDQNLTFYRPQPLGRAAGGAGPGPADAVAAGPARILEIKLWGDIPTWLAAAVDGLRPAPRFSKFRMGMMALGRRVAPPPDGDPDPASVTTPTAFTSEPVR
jgi:hypothetical protein